MFSLLKLITRMQTMKAVKGVVSFWVDILTTYGERSFILCCCYVVEQSAWFIHKYTALSQSCSENQYDSPADGGLEVGNLQDKQYHKSCYADEVQHG